MQGKRVLITGASGGLGAETMRLLQEMGAHVVGLDRSAGSIDRPSHIVQADVRDAEAVKRAVAQAIGQLGGLDVLINNAGILGLQQASAMPDSDVLTTLDVNFLGAWRVTAAALPALMAVRGRVVNVASMFAVVSVPYIAAYAASKRALTAYSDILRAECGGRIGVTTLFPGYMNTAIHRGALSKGLSVARLVTFYMGERKLASLEEPLRAAARGVVRACQGRLRRERGLTPLGALSFFAARHFPGLVDGLVGWRLKRLLEAGALKIDLTATAKRDERE